MGNSESRIIIGQKVRVPMGLIKKKGLSRAGF
jgi:hypothetical protein